MPAASTTALPPGRRADLDWLRIVLFLGLIFYHEGLLYETGRPGVSLALLATHPWRMNLLFLISGSATRYMAERHSAAGLTAERSLRLLPPLLFAVLLLVPIQLYFAVVDHSVFSGTYFDFLRTYFAAPDKMVTPGQQPIYGHLWFVVYLWTYTMVLCAALALKPNWVAAGGRALGRLTGLGLLIGPYVVLSLLRMVAYPQFHMSLDFVDDWYNHIVSSGMFLLGFLAAQNAPFWEQLRRLRWPALVMALIGFGAYSAIGLHFGAPNESIEDGRPELGLFYCMEQWGAVVAVLGFGYRYLGRGASKPAPRYLTAAIFTYYIVHEPAMMAAWHFLKPLGLNPKLEAVLVGLVTVAACALAYEGARRTAFLGVALGQRRFGSWSFARKKPAPKGKPPAPKAEAETKRDLAPAE